MQRQWPPAEQSEPDDEAGDGSRAWRPHDGASWRALCLNGNAPYGSESEYASCTTWNDATNDAPNGRSTNGTNAWNDVFSNAWNDDVSYVSGFHAACLTARSK